MDEGGRILLSLTNGKDFKIANTFRIAAEIRRLVGEVEAARPDAKGNLVITTKNQQQTEILLQQDRFLDQEAYFDCPQHLNTVEAYVYAPVLTEVPDEEIIAELRDQGVVGIFRLRQRNGRKNPGMRLHILGKTIPTHIRAGFQDIPLRPWRRSPLLCRRCASHGHTQKNCRADTLRCLRCADPHATDDCGAAKNLCPHCGGGHPGWDRRCEVLKSLFNNQETPAWREPTPKTDASTQTGTSTRDVAITARPHTSAAATGPGPATTKTTAVQTNNIPVFTGPAVIVEEDAEAEEHSSSASEKNDSDRRWDVRTRAQRDAELPPAARTRSSYKDREQTTATAGLLVHTHSQEPERRRKRSSEARAKPHQDAASDRDTTSAKRSLGSRLTSGKPARSYRWVEGAVRRCRCRLPSRRLAGPPS